ncbi:hypothetical protein [Burkholderia ubonensis]|uniref:Uncharacterized protein n=1 Tax=Burkholderia ubonensis TaxID=101571 RepID=A0ABD4DZ93_9BURK|nr:hypothetical protein [Burkholderia ubonensis]KVN83429.1 hypothetical protein WJ68_16065 [Burkholderia ubonensis]
MTYKNPQELPITQQDMSAWLRRALGVQAGFRRLPTLITAERALNVVPADELDAVSEIVIEQIRRRLSNYEREAAAAALSAIADVLAMGSACRTPHNVAQGVVLAHSAHERDRAILHECCALFSLEPFDTRKLPEAIRKLKTLAGKGELTDEHDRLENAARAIAPNYYADSWECEPDSVEGAGALIGARHEDGSLNDFIHVYISDYSMEEGDDEALAAYLALARPTNIAAMFDVIRAQAKEIAGYKAELERINGL